MNRPTQTPGSTSDAKKRLTLVATPCCDAAAKVECRRQFSETQAKTIEALTATLSAIDAMVERAERKGYDLSADDLRAALDGPAGGGGCA